MSHPPSSAWAALGDLLLAREALALRARRGVPADALVGLHVDEEEVDRLLREFVGADPVGAAEPSRREASIEGVDQRIEDARAGFDAALQTQPVLYGLAHRLGLGLEVAQVLAFLCAVDLEPRRQRLVAYVQDDASAVRPRLHTIARLFGVDHPGLDALAPDGILLRSRLVTLGTGRPWGSTEVVLDPMLGWASTGRLSLDPALPAGWRLLETGRGPDGDEPDLALIWGSDRVRRLQGACRLLRDPFALAGPTPPDDDGWSAVVRTATVCGFGVVVESSGSLTEEDRRSIEHADHLAFAILSVHPLPVQEVPRRPHVEQPSADPVVSDDEYVEAVGAPPPPGHRITADQLHAITTRAANSDPAAALVRLAAGSMEALARRITPRRSFDDLVVEPPVRRQLLDLVERYRNRNRVAEWTAGPRDDGITALFAGPSGTGKTLSAEVVAGALGLEVFKVDLSSVVSKWLGETEQNLERIFAAAEATQQVLLFDEADALFGKRSAVSDARDRYANVETAYLLQRLESYGGLAILTTNLRQNLDEAFTRRLSAFVDFSLPGPEERRLLWERALRSAPVDGAIDTGRLAADFELSGGLITSAAITAMHFAVAEASAVRPEHVQRALRSELGKAGRLVPPVPEPVP